MSSELLEINRTLGKVMAKLDNIADDVRAQAAVQEKTSEAIQALELRTVFLERDVNAAKPFIDKAKQWEQRGIGMIATVSAVGAIFGGVIIGFRDQILMKLGIN